MLTRKERRFKEVHIDQDLEVKVVKNAGDEHFKYVIKGSKEHIALACACLLDTLIQYKVLNINDIDCIDATVIKHAGGKHESK